MQVSLLLMIGLGAAIVISVSVSTTDLALYEDNKCYGINVCPGGTVTNIGTDSMQIDGIWVTFSLLDIINEDDTTAFLNMICPVESNVQIELDKRYGGLNAEIFCNEQSLNGELVKNGYAITNKSNCRNSDFAVSAWADC